MKKVLLLAIAVLISVAMASCRKSCPVKTRVVDTLWEQHTLYECISLKGTETNVNVHVKKGEKPDGIYASGGNFFWVNFVDENSPEEVQIPHEVKKENNDFSMPKVKRSYIVLLKEGETVDFVGRYGFIVRTWDRAIRVRYIYEE